MLRLMLPSTPFKLTLKPVAATVLSGISVTVSSVQLENRVLVLRTILFVCRLCRQYEVMQAGIRIGALPFWSVNAFWIRSHQCLSKKFKWILAFSVGLNSDYIL